MKIAFVADPLEALDASTDTTADALLGWSLCADLLHHVLGLEQPGASDLRRYA